MLAKRAVRGPVLEYGFYVLLVALEKLESLTMQGLPTLLARLSRIVGSKSAKTSLRRLRLDRDLLFPDELAGLAQVCPEVIELSNVSRDICAEDDFFDFSLASLQHFPDRHSSKSLCAFLKHFRSLQTFQGRVSLSCINSFMRYESRGATLTSLHLTTDVFDTAELLHLRKYAPNLTRLKCKLMVAPNEDLGFAPHDFGHGHELATEEKATSKALRECSGPFSAELVQLLADSPMKGLKVVELEGQMTLMAVQLLVGNADALEELHVTCAPLGGNADTILGDEWFEGVLRVNVLSQIKAVTLRTNNEQPVEAGAFTGAGLSLFLEHCLKHCAKFRDLVGEFTRVPDKTLEARRSAFEARGLRGLRVRNALPYRRFENPYDSERHYSINEGYRMLMQEQQHLLMQQQHRQQQQGEDKSGQGQQRAHKRFAGYVFRPYNP